VEKTFGKLNTFIIEPFCKHTQEEEYYVCIQSIREGDMVFFTHEGGVDVGDVDAKASKMLIPVNKPFPSALEMKSTLLTSSLISLS
jgi:ATP citrate (pro-S)-lyase